MKELSIEQKAQRYDEAIERLRNAFYDNSSRMCEEYSKAAIKILEPIFPELQVSEDEKIKHEIKVILANTDLSQFALDYTFADMIAWLEKQGEQRTQGKTAIEAIKEEKVDNANKIEPKDYSSIDPHFGKPIDKVEPKFKVGDWIISHYNNVAYIKSIDEKNYFLSCNDGNTVRLDIDYINRDWRLWTIQDAKDGDVLFIGIDSSTCIFKKLEGNLLYSYIISDGKLLVEDSHYYYETCDNVHPATKEQRDLLFQKMNEAGYEWDAYKKELKKIEQKPAEWSEEDEEIIHCLEYTVKHFYEDKDTINRCCNWLKSLRPCPRWKPSDEQMDALDDVISSRDIKYDVLSELWKDLKQL